MFDSFSVPPSTKRGLSERVLRAYSSVHSLFKLSKVLYPVFTGFVKYFPNFRSLFPCFYMPEASVQTSL